MQIENVMQIETACQCDQRKIFKENFYASIN